jgi:hypothetical protein
VTSNATLVLRLWQACPEALAWVEAQPDQSPQALWDACPRGDWLSDYLATLAMEYQTWRSPVCRRAVLIACLCARTALPHAGRWRDEVDALLSRVEAWTQEAFDLRPVGARLRTLRREAYAAYAHEHSEASACAVDAIDAAICTAHGVRHAHMAVDYAVRAVAPSDPARHLADLADMIRSACPVVPLGIDFYQMERMDREALRAEVTP